ncbi:MAG: recombinase family protein [Lachnospiraceae bacterium]|nr:recombinase family protein [Lachnospiraceae bacterium]
MKNVEYETYYVQDEHEGIVSREVWDQVKAIFEKEKQEREVGIHRTKAPTHFLYGTVFCAECGSPMVCRTYTNRNKTRYKAWNCRERFRGKNDCKNPAIREDDLIAEIVSALKEHCCC